MESLLLEWVGAQGAVALLAALLVGVLTSLAPCSLLTLPLLVSSALQMNRDLPEAAKKRFTYWFSAWFAAGLVVSLSLLGMLAAQFGYLFSLAPREAYLLAALVALLLGLRGLGLLPEFDQAGLLRYLIQWRLGGAFAIGAVFGLVSTPCATPPLGAIMLIAADSSLGYALALMLAFALGHGGLLVAAGLSLGTVQTLLAHRALGRLSAWTGRVFTGLLLLFAAYFLYQAFRHPSLWH